MFQVISLNGNSQKRMELMYEMVKERLIDGDIAL